MRAKGVERGTVSTQVPAHTEGCVSISVYAVVGMCVCRSVCLFGGGGVLFSSVFSFLHPQNTLLPSRADLVCWCVCLQRSQ